MQLTRFAESKPELWSLNLKFCSDDKKSLFETFDELHKMVRCYLKNGNKSLLALIFFSSSFWVAYPNNSVWDHCPSLKVQLTWRQAAGSRHRTALGFSKGLNSQYRYTLDLVDKLIIIDCWTMKIKLTFVIIITIIISFLL